MRDPTVALMPHWKCAPMEPYGCKWEQSLTPWTSEELNLSWLLQPQVMGESAMCGCPGNAGSEVRPHLCAPFEGAQTVTTVTQNVDISIANIVDCVQCLNMPFIAMKGTMNESLRHQVNLLLSCNSSSWISWSLENRFSTVKANIWGMSWSLMHPGDFDPFYFLTLN